jgi:hypothetical protein
MKSIAKIKNMACWEFVAAGCLLLVGDATFAQPGLPSLSIKAGVIRNLQAPFYRDLPKYSFYPEIQINGQISRSSSLAVSALSGLYWGYWDDGVDETSNACRDCHTYSFSSHIIGARMGLLLEKFPLVPTGFAIGLSRHFIRANYVGGLGLAGDPGQDFERWATTTEAIVYTYIDLGKKAGVIIEFQKFWLAGNNYLYPYLNAQFNRSAFKLGFAYSL